MTLDLLEPATETWDNPWFDGELYWSALEYAHRMRGEPCEEAKQIRAHLREVAESERQRRELEPWLPMPTRLEPGETPNRLVSSPQLYADECRRVLSPDDLEALAAVDTEAKRQELAAALLPLRARRAERLAFKARLRREHGLDDTWHRTRAASLGVPMLDKVRHGREHEIGLQHKETGELREVCNCKQVLCERCQAAKVAKVRRWAELVVEAHDKAERARVKKLVRRDGELEVEVEEPDPREPVLLTFTVRASGDPAADALRLREAWPRFRAWCSRTFGSFTYLRAEECTPGEQDEKTGHVHWHCCAWWPAWVDYRSMHRAWWRALGWGDAECGCGRDGSGPAQCGETGPCGVHRCGPHADGTGRAECTAAEPCSRHAPGNVDVQRKPQGESTGADALAYATKAFDATKVFTYATKDGTAFDAMAIEALAQYLDGRYGQRWVTASVGFWHIAERPEPEWQVVPEQEWPRAPRASDDWWRQHVVKDARVVRSSPELEHESEGRSVQKRSREGPEDARSTRATGAQSWADTG